MMKPNYFDQLFFFQFPVSADYVNAWLNVFFSSVCTMLPIQLTCIVHYRIELQQCYLCFQWNMCEIVAQYVSLIPQGRTEIKL